METRTIPQRSLRHGILYLPSPFPRSVQNASSEQRISPTLCIPREWLGEPTLRR